MKDMFGIEQIFFFERNVSGLQPLGKYLEHKNTGLWPVL